MDETKEILEKLNGLAKSYAKTDAKIDSIAKRTDEKIAGFTDEIKRHFGVVVEGLEDQIKLIAEGHMDTTRRLDSIDNRMDKMDGRFDGIDNRLDKMDGRFDGIDNRLDVAGEKLDFISEKTVANSQDLGIVKNDLNFIKQDLKRKVDYDEFAALEKRVLALENRGQKARAI